MLIRVLADVEQVESSDLFKGTVVATEENRVIMDIYVACGEWALLF